MYRSLDEFKSALAAIGYTDLKNKTQQKVIVNIDRGGDRVATLENIAKKLKGKYNDKSSESSIGRTELPGGYIAIAKIKGGGGSGAGSALTELVESAQCVYNATHYAGDTFSKTNLKKNKSAYDISSNINAITDTLPDDWIFSSKIVAEVLKKKFPASKKYTHHRGSAWVSKLEKHWAVLNKEAGSPFSNLNKWSPADIWMVSQKGASVDLSRAQTLADLNALLLKNLKSKDIVGVSLKKVVSNSPNYKELNTSKDRPIIKFEGTSSGLRGFFSSGDGYLYFNTGKAQFRTFGSTWQGELKGKNANMGKVSGGPIIGVVKQVANIQMIPQSRLMQRKDADIKLFWQWYSDLPDQKKMTYKDFAAEVAKKDMNWFISKAMTAQLISIVEKLSPAKKDKFTSALVNYAASESELSGPYVKVY